MKYRHIRTAEFIERPNRFIAKVMIDGHIETVHVKNTGRCSEILRKGAKVYLEESENPMRKTRYDLVSVVKKRNDGSLFLINIDSQIPNNAVDEWLRKGELFGSDALIRREYTYGSSRFDFIIEEKEKTSFLEVKGVTLEYDGIAFFPDAPTERGVKHIRELIKARMDGYGAYIMFVIQMKGIHEFRPNESTHKAFAEALREAERSGVRLLAYDCIVTPESLRVDKPIKIRTEQVL